MYQKYAVRKQDGSNLSPWMNFNDLTQPIYGKMMDRYGVRNKPLCKLYLIYVGGKPGFSRCFLFERPI